MENYIVSSSSDSQSAVDQAAQREHQLPDVEKQAEELRQQGHPADVVQFNRDLHNSLVAVSSDKRWEIARAYESAVKDGQDVPECAIVEASKQGAEVLHHILASKDVRAGLSELKSAEEVRAEVKRISSEIGQQGESYSDFRERRAAEEKARYDRWKRPAR